MDTGMVTLRVHDGRAIIERQRRLVADRRPRRDGPTKAEALLATFATVQANGVSMIFRRNQEIYGQGEPAPYLYGVVGGAVRVSRILVDGRRKIGAFYVAGDLFGLDGDEHSFSAEALLDCRIIVIKRSVLRALVQHDADIARGLLMLTERELVRAQEHALLLTKTAQERVAGFLLEMAARSPDRANIRLPMPRLDIADYLGLTIETVSRTLTILEQHGIIEVPNVHQIVLRDRPALKAMNG
jgi:CRP/FNR family transcriptional regulator, nitrogen fixation regulation protein